MNYLYFAAGAILYTLIALDVIKTAFSSRGGGLITGLVTRATWGLFFNAVGRRGNAKLLEYAGPTMLSGILCVWVAGLWLGLFLMLMADPRSIVSASTELTATPLEKLYYAGFTLSTLGVGDYKATTDFWRVLTSLSAFSGLVFITTAITYFVPVLSAVSLQNKLSLYISAMGRTPQAMLINGWNGKDCSAFYSNVPNLCEMLMQHIMHHHAYPVIHHFHTSNPQLAIMPALVRLDEVRRLLTHAVDEHAAERQMALNMLATTLDAYMDMVRSNFLDDATPRERPPTPQLAPLQQAGMPLREDLAAQLEQPAICRRRELLSVLLERDGWSWRDVYGG